VSKPAGTLEKTMPPNRLQKGRGRLGASVLFSLLATASACKGTIGTTPINSTLPPNVCTSAQVALTDPDCELTLNEWKYHYLATLQEQDWFSVNVGAVDSLSIVHIIAGYFPPGDTDGGAPDCATVDGGFNTAVNLTMNVLKQDGETSLATAADEHGSACPKPMDITFKYTLPNTSLVMVLEDDTGQKFDTQKQYGIVASVVEDPDVNEPNDTPQTATPIPLTSSGSGIQTGQSGGYLSTPGDLDYYSVTSPGTNYVLWVQVSQDPAVPSPPPHNYRLEYYVYGPDGTTQVAQGYARAGSQYSASRIILADAILLNQAGPYYILVQGYRDANTVGTVPGDLNFKYLVQVETVPLQDPTEPNNTFDTAFVANGGTAIPVGGSATITGRTSYVGDADWYAVNLAASAVPELLHYKLTPGTTGGRFPELPTNPTRTLFGYTLVPDTTSCLTDAGVCVLSAPKDSTPLAIAQSACAESPPKCLQSYRVESIAGAPGPVLTNLKNFESVLQVPPHAAAVTYYFFLQAVGFDPTDNNGYWADDKDYTLLFEHMAEPDTLEAIPDPPRLATLGPSAGPIAATPVYLSYGIGQPNPGHTINDVVFGPGDYDGRGDDVDTYQISLPFSTEQAWQVSWSVPVGPDGVNPVYDLGYTLSFCDVDAGTSTPPCSVMVTHPQSNSSDQLGFGYTDSTIDSWWNPNGDIIPDQLAYTQIVAGGMVTTTVLPYACFCFEPRFVSTGTSYFLMNIFPVNRTSWVPLAPYTVTTSYSAYPYPASGTTLCPNPCNFTLN
jgi:hypothetical protein